MAPGFPTKLLLLSQQIKPFLTIAQGKALTVNLDNFFALVAHIRSAKAIFKMHSLTIHYQHTCYQSIIVSLFITVTEVAILLLKGT